MKTNAEDLYHKLQTELKYRGIEIHRIAAAQTGSVYIGFDVSGMGKLRIGDHEERERYGYRWQIRLDQKNDYIIKESKGHRQYFYSPKSIYRLIDHLCSYRNIIINRLKKEGTDG